MAILEDRGIFWWNDEAVPEGNFAPEASVHGKVTIDDNGSIRLELDGVMPSDKHPFEAVMTSGETVGNIQGLLTKSGRVLLIKSFHSGGSARSNNISRESYVARQCLVSESPFARDGKAPIKYSALTIDLKGYEKWMWMRSIKWTRHRNSLVVKYKAEKDQHFSIPTGKLSIEYDMLGPYLGSSCDYTLSLTETAQIRLQTSEAMSLSNCQKYYQITQDLLILLTSSDYSLDWPEVRLWRRKQTAKLYFMRSRSDAKPPDAHDCLINFPKTVGSFGDLFAAMVEKREQYGPGIYLYLATRRGMKMLVEHRFVNLIWGLEALNRQDVSQGGGAEKTKLEKKIERIISQIVLDKDKKWLEKKIQHASEPTLSDRLFSIFSALPIDFDTAVLRKFCTECQNRRNDISHFGGLRDRDQPYDTFMHDLDAKSDALSCLYHLHLLSLIGVDKEQLSMEANSSWPMSRIGWALRRVGLLPPEKNPFSEPTML